MFVIASDPALRAAPPPTMFKAPYVGSWIISLASAPSDPRNASGFAKECSILLCSHSLGVYRHLLDSADVFIGGQNIQVGKLWVLLDQSVYCRNARRVCVRTPTKAHAD
jgi:hypothetical protein